MSLVMCSGPQHQAGLLLSVCVFIRPTQPAALATLRLVSLPSLPAPSCMSSILILALHCGGAIPLGLLPSSFCPTFPAVTGPLPPSEALVWKGPGGEKCKLPAMVNKIAEICMAQSSPEMPPTREWVGSGQQVAASKKRKLRNMITTICGRCE